MRKRFIKKQMDIAAQIHELLEKTGWSQKELSKKSGVPEQTLSTIRSGHANPTLKTLIKVEEALDADIITTPKAFKKTIKRRGFRITNKSLSEGYHIDLDEWVSNRRDIHQKQGSVGGVAPSQYSDSYTMTNDDLYETTANKAA